jgi:hypothetical protein
LCILICKFLFIHQGNPKTWCLEDKEYPKYEIEAALQYNYEGVQAIYKDVLANTENSVDRLKEIVQETYLCPSVTSYIQVKISHQILLFNFVMRNVKLFF